MILSTENFRHSQLLTKLTNLLKIENYDARILYSSLIIIVD